MIEEQDIEQGPISLRDGGVQRDAAFAHMHRDDDIPESDEHVEDVWHSRSHVVMPERGLQQRAKQMGWHEAFEAKLAEMESEESPDINGRITNLSQSLGMALYDNAQVTIGD